MGACTECQQNCAFIHGQHYPGPAVTTFFKPMICADFLQTLYLPPYFVKATSHLADQEIYLEDSKGIKSKATVSRLKDTLVIQQGWHQFSQSHNIEKGDFLVFHYLTRPVDHFVVHIYGHSGCLKTSFDATPTDRSNKRARTVDSSPPPVDETINNNAFIPSNLGGEAEGIHVNSANIEQPNTPGNSSHQSFVCAPIVDEVRHKGKKSCLRSADVEEPLHMSKNELCKGKMKSQENELMQLVVHGAFPSTSEKPKSAPFDKKITFLEEREPEEPIEGKVQTCIAEAGGPSNDEKDNLIKKETAIVVKEVNITNNDRKVVKTEPEPDPKPVEASSTDLCVALVDGREFLELPDTWIWRDKQQDKVVVYLTDPTRRVWPVLLHRKHHFKVLTGGWKDLSAANMLRPGDGCVFHHVRMSEYRVDIRRKGNGEGSGAGLK